MITDILIEFIEVLIHNILYVSGTYPKSIFDKLVKYDLPVRYIIHPQVNTYITDCLSSIKELITNKTLQRIDIAFYSEHKKTGVFTFHIDFNCESTDTDPYLLKLEHSLRSHFLKVMNMQPKFTKTSENSTFKILMYTDELSAVTLPKSTYNSVPLVEDEDTEKFPSECVTPVGNISLANISIQTFIITELLQG